MVLLTPIFIGCSHTGEVRGQFVDSSGVGISNAEVEFWRNASLPPALPEKVATALTDEDGFFSVFVNSSVHFIVAQAPGYYGSLGSYRLGREIDQMKLVIESRTPTTEPKLEQIMGGNE